MEAAAAGSGGGGAADTTTRHLTHIGGWARVDRLPIDGQEQFRTDGWRT